MRPKEHENQENDFTDFIAAAGAMTVLLMGIFVVVTVVQLLI